MMMSGQSRARDADNPQPIRETDNIRLIAFNKDTV